MLKLLVVEQYNHFKVLENTYHLLKSHCILTFYINTDRENNLLYLFPSSKKAQIIINPLHKIFYFTWVIINGWKYDLINIATGPEQDHYSHIINILLFYICCVIYEHKIILTIKNTRSYLDNTPGLYSRVRSRAIKKINRFTFETKTLMEYFRKEVQDRDCLLSVSYDRYTDIDRFHIPNNSKSKNDNIVNVGLLGILTDFRRDYNIIFDILDELVERERKQFLFVTLGATPGGNDNLIIKRFMKLSNIDYISGWITAEQFNDRGRQCDILISSLKKELEYGTYKGSGSFGDAIYLRKKIIIPDYVDPKKEFGEIGVYYKDKNELKNIFSNINNYTDVDINMEFYEKFTTKNVLNNIIKDLRINCD